jgi:GntR family transcriptional repressor for pyruvate dehydrogenase complex
LGRRPNTPLTEFALTALRELIAKPSMANGGRFPPEAELAAQLNISRPVLRHALDVLKREGVIEARRGSGTYVRRSAPERPSVFGWPQTLSDLADCHNFRAVVERGAATEAARHGNDESIAEIEEAMLAMENPTHGNAVAEADTNFHMAIAKATGNQYYLMTLQLLQPHILFALRLGRELRSVALSSTSRRVEQEHRAIFDAIKSRDVGLAGERMEVHLAAGVERIFGKRPW